MGRLAKRADNNFDSFPGGNSLMRITKKKIVGAVAVSAVVALGAGSAYAFWTSTGSGSGSADVGADTPVAINTANVQFLAPGVELPLELKIDNTNPYNVYLPGGVEGVITVTPATGAPNAARPCAASDFELVYPTTRAIDVPAAAAGTEYTNSTDYKIRMKNLLPVTDPANNQDNCKNATIAIAWSEV